MPVVSVRISDETAAILRRRHIRPSAKAREALEAEAQYQLLLEAQEKLDKMGLQATHDSTALIREDRDSDHGRLRS